MAGDGTTNACSESRTPVRQMSTSCPGSELGGRYAPTMSGSSLEPRHLRSALQFAVDVARESQKIKSSPLKFPVALKKYFQATRIPPIALASVQRAVESDEAFRAALAMAATPDLVDDVGRAWLARGEGWEAEVVRLAAEADAEAAVSDAEARLRRAEKRLEAAQQS